MNNAKVDIATNSKLRHAIRFQINQCKIQSIQIISFLVMSYDAHFRC